MFKLESYITPILLNYVAKYVKNIRDEDAQVSLWEGEVTFQNLDMRLDVLEDELNLPVELVSGHIHELSIQVPWTKLMSEPVRIVINTIEFVAKLPDEDRKERRAMYIREQRRKTKASADLQEETQQPGSTGSGVVNKIINNINLECNNIILKYVEDDIVVSMNVQTLSFCSANENWKPAMVDVNPIAVLIRKLLQISDLTICLDKRNTAGRIEVCQEPVLYRCTLECRVLRKYNVNTLSTSSSTRIGVFTKALDINVSSLQLPMVMRLVKMLLELKPIEMEDDPPNFEEHILASAAAEQQTTSVAPSSMFRWAWNLLPSFDTPLPVSSANEEPGHAFDIGMYAEELNFQLKNSEYVMDQGIGGIKRIRYTPILRISLGGIYYERSQLKETDWTNVRAGLSSICMVPLGIYRSEDPMDRTLVHTQEFLNERSFIDKSLFDENYAFSERPWCTNNHDDYFARHTDEYMLFRSPVLAFDIVEYRTLKPSAGKASDSPELKLKDAGLRVQYRLLSAGITFHFSQSFLQVKNVISDLLRPYDYSGYHAETAMSERKMEDESWTSYNYNDLSLADLEYLLSVTQLCNYKIELRNMTVQFYPRQQIIERLSESQTQLSNSFKQSQLPYLQLRLPLAEGTMCGPVNPKRVVQLISLLQDKPRELIDACYNVYKFEVKNLTLMALNTTPEKGKVKLLHIPRMQVNFHQLLLPHLWRPNDAPLEIGELQSEIISLEFSKRELILVTRLIPLLMSYHNERLSSLADLVSQASATSDVIKLQTLASKFRFSYRKYHEYIAFLTSLRGLNSDSYHSMMNMRNVVLATNKGQHNKWFELQLQLPYGEQDPEREVAPATVVALWIEPCRFTLDIYLLQFLQFREKYSKEPEKDLETICERSYYDRQYSASTHSSFNAFQRLNDPTPRHSSRNSRKISVPEETVHLSSERDEKVHVDLSRAEPNSEDSSSTDGFDLAKLISKLTNMVLMLDIATIKIDVCELMARKSPKETDVELTSIHLPRIKMKSGNSKSLSRSNIRSIVELDSSVSTYNWTAELSGFDILYRKRLLTEQIVVPVRTTIALALAHKVLEENEPKRESKPDDKSAEPSFDTRSDSMPDPERKVDWLDKQIEREKRNERLGHNAFGSYSINVHVDMSAINVHIRHMKLLYEHYQILFNIVNSIYELKEFNSVRVGLPQRLEIYTGSAQNHPTVKEFLSLDGSFDPSKLPKNSKKKIALVFFCQWTIPRITFQIESFANYKKRKIILSFEDLLLNVDKHADFTKYTSKVENIALNYYEAKINTEWVLMEGLRIKMLGDNTNLPLLNIVITTVRLEDLYTKIGASNLYNKQHTISELIVQLQAIEMVLDLDRINEFIRPLCHLLDMMRSTSKSVVKTPKRDSITTVQDLPMVHLNSKGIYIYLPMKTEKNLSSVLLLRIESINLTSTLENPLVRQPIRQDVYQKAAELDMLTTPGSLVEDRQYELNVHNISLSSGNWEQTQKYLLESQTSSHSNPAFEWNNQSRSTQLEHVEIFAGFDFIIIYAPAMSYENLLVCGQTVEYNCISDFVATLNTHQINLISCIIIRVQRLRSILDEFCVIDIESNEFMASSGGTSYDSLTPSVLSVPYSLISAENTGIISRDEILLKRASLNSIGKPVGIGSKRNSVTPMARQSFLDAKSSSDVFVGSCQSDSGIHVSKYSMLASSPPYGTEEPIQMTKIQPYPQTVSFVAGVFVLKIYDVLGSDESAELILKPLILVTISQPSFMAITNLRQSTTQASIFNFNVHMSEPDFEELTNETHSKLFTEVIFDTLPGEMGSSGIPPPLLTIKQQEDRLNQVELDVELGKPIVLRLCETNVKQLTSDLIRIYSVLHESPCFTLRTERPVLRLKPLGHLKLQCFGADRMHVACHRITAKFYDKQHTYKCSAVCLDFNARIKFSERPQKAAIKASLGAFYLQAANKIVLHPLLMRLSADLRSEQWCNQILINATLKLNMLHLDAGVLSILVLQKARAGLASITEHFNVQWQYFLKNRPILGQPEILDVKTLLQYEPSDDKVVHSKIGEFPQTEFYQDDLRAGAFQFVYLNTDAVLPMPYQVQIIKKNYGIICWRYPQPRKMNNIFIYPVPMPVNNPIQIKCRMEYFSETYETFLHYCDFELSETMSKKIAPPERQVCANIWRVVIMQSLISVNGACFEAEEDEDVQTIDSSNVDQECKTNSDNDFILHPKVLVGCMRIDTTFQAASVPKLQLLLSCKDIEINFLNQPDAYNELPPKLKRYHLNRTTEISQTFATVIVQNLHLYTSIYHRNDFTVETDFYSRIKCLDYGFLNMIDIMEPMIFQSYINFNGQQRLLQTNILIDKLRFNCGPCVIHTLLSSKQHWQELLQSREVCHTLMPKCVVVNRMQAFLSFGQTDTSERIAVAPNELQLYHFRSDYQTQELTFFIKNPETHQVESSDSVHIPLKFDDEHSVRHLRVGKRCITIKVGKLSATQVYILVKGQIELLSMVPYELLTEFRREGKKYDDQNPLDHILPAKGRASFYQTVVRNADINMRLKLNAGRGKGRTGDIPLKPNNSLPWLVKVPIQGPHQFISLWVRILREDIELHDVVDDFQPQKILVSIWPIFEICNMLSCPLEATEHSTEEHLSIAAEGGHSTLNTPTTHATEHKVSFEFPVELGEGSEREYTFMLNSMDWHKFFHYDPQKWGIELALQKLGRALKPKWPLNEEEELRVHRNTTLANAFDVHYRTQATREFSCTLGLDITAYAMFINATGLSLSIYQAKNRQRFLLKPNSLEMVSTISDLFTVEVSHGQSWRGSSSICLDELTDVVGSGTRYTVLRANSFLDIVIMRNEEVLKLLLEYKNEDNRRIFKLRCKFVLTNFTNIIINALPLTMDHKETSSREEVHTLDVAKKNRNLISVETTSNCIGVTVETFYDLNSRKAKHSSDTAFLYFVCLSVSGSWDISIPIPLSMPFTRRCFSVQNGPESIPLVATLIEKDNVHYLNVFKDTAPALVISNHTNIKFIVAQTSASGNSNVTSTTPEFVGKHFEWNQLVSPKSDCYYTPPQMYANFPDVEFTICNLSLAVYNENAVAGKKKIGWSKPIRTDRTWKKFLHVPTHGDVKVVVCDKHRVIRVAIYYISQQMEFSVKDLRSRLNQPQSDSNEHLEQTSNEDEPDSLDTEKKHCIQQFPTCTDEQQNCMHFSNTCETKRRMKVRIFIKKFVFSLQTDNRERDYLKTEVCNIYMDDMMLAYDDDDDQCVLNVQVPNLQVDNQLYSSGKFDFPVLLCSEKLYARNSNKPNIYDLDAAYVQQAEQAPIALVTFVFYEDELQVNHLRCKFHPFRVYIEDAYLNQLLETLVECEPSNCVHMPQEESARLQLIDGQTLLPEDVVAQALYIADPLRLNSFTVEPLNLLLSVHTSSRLYIALDHSPLSFSRYERQQILTVPLRFGQSLGLHYLSGAIFGAGWVVGSLEILGSPSGLARSFTTGLRDFISMPVQGLFRGPWGFVVGITQGSASLLRNVTAGTVNSVTKLASSVARNLDRLTLDAEHIELTEARRRARPQGFADGLTQGMTGLGISLLGAVGGLAHHTLEARSSVGVITGLTKGIVGALTKPISGAAEMLALTGQGVLHTVGFNAMPQQVEPSVPRNVALHRCSYCIWRLLPEELSRDQILFSYEITLLVHEQLRPALVFLTSTVLAIMEAGCDDLTFVSPVNKVELVTDRDDPSKLYLNLKPEKSDDLEGQLSFTNERILRFLNGSRLQMITAESLNDLLVSDIEPELRQTQCVFFIKQNIGEHLIYYLRVINKLQLV